MFLSWESCVFICTSMIPIGRITKSHEEVPSIVIWVISTPIVVTRAYITKLGLLEPT